MNLKRGEIVAPPYTGWARRAACRTIPVSSDEAVDPFFTRSKLISKKMKKVCRNECPVRAECLRYAIAHGERFGIWGGETWATRHRWAKDHHGTPEHWQSGCRCPHCEEAQARRREVTGATGGGKRAIRLPL